MKTKLFLLLSFSMFMLGLKAQILNLEGNFKAKLVASSSGNMIAKDLNGNYFAVDANADGDISKNEAEKVSELNLSNSNIHELDGIFQFRNLVKLDCSNNTIQRLELQGLESLQTIIANNNNIAGAYFQYSPNIKNIDLANNSLIYINVSNLPNLITVNLSGNQLSGLSFIDAHPNNIQTLNVSNNPVLTEVLKDSSDILPSTGSISQTISTIPYLDPTFKAALLYSSSSNMVAKNLSNQYFKIDANVDGILQLSELSQIKELDLNESYPITPTSLSSINTYGMINLKKIKYDGVGLENMGQTQFYYWGSLYDVDLKGSPNLETIAFNDHPLRGIDVSNMANLTSLEISIENNSFTPTSLPEKGMRLKYLKGENCTSLINIDLSFQSALEMVNLKNCISLTQFNHNHQDYFGPNHISSPEKLALRDVNLEGCTNLVSTNVARTSLTNLNVKNCPNLQEIIAYKGLLTTIDNILMDNSPNIKALSVTANKITNVNLLKMPSVEILDCNSNMITSIQGSSNNLKKLHVFNNNLTAFNIHSTPNLELISIGYNKFVDIDFSGHQKLQSILIKDYGYNEFYDSNMPTLNGDNYLKSLNVNNCPNMQNFILASSVLERLYIKNGVNEMIDYLIASPSQFICCDASEAAAIQDQLDMMGNTTCAVYTDCNTTGPVLSTNNISNEKNSVNIYPNPTKGDVNIAADSKINSIEIYDAQGRIIQKQIGINSQNTKVSIHSNTSGIYILKIITEKETLTKKIIKN
ncbi:T9SS type A sorting domain-containing protein [Chryseobacterium sp. G0201]|uniref:T9SS type A sorting domain-containing protein n=1 Tax=Chryseobacterium sp. G0201 TaxID=2487065 RepID=UPI000F4F9D97|nr:T9SS type A sorting domain-containing protein [Chryseobacterium sp. G0201]AZA53190.1 T9SS C-terminal target domain-containing protein [Chryseobacterium sp. G0201]